MFAYKTIANKPNGLFRGSCPRWIAWMTEARYWALEKHKQGFR
jgi:hypothetical protein